MLEFIAHRGESIDAPENTLAAFRLAWERSVPAIELDVHRTRDGVLVVCHDADTHRTTGVRRTIAESAAADLRDLTPTLAEALATIPDGCRCLIEVKVGPEAVPALVAEVRASGKSPQQLPVISFNADTLAEAKRHLPEHETYFLAGSWPAGVDALIRTARGIGADGLNLWHGGPIDAALVEAVKAAGLGMYVWTVDDVEVARRMASYGVDGITSNRAAFLRDALRLER